MENVMIACAECPVREHAICRSLPAEDGEKLAAHARRQTLQKGSVLQWEDDESLLVGNVIEGVLKLSCTTSGGREQTLGLAYPGDFVGRPFGRKSGHSVVALSDARVCTFRRADFDSVARANQPLEHELLERALTDLDQTRRWMVLLGRNNAAQKIATFLLDMADRAALETDDGEDVATVFDLPCGRQEVADILGTTIETVSRQITELRQAGIIETPGRRSVAILDRDALEDIAEAA